MRTFGTAALLTITADCGGSNGAGVRLWKVELQKLAGETGLCDSRLPLSAAHIKVEQDRAPAVLPHHRTGATCPRLLLASTPSSANTSRALPTHALARALRSHLGQPLGSDTWFRKRYRSFFWEKYPADCPRRPNRPLRSNLSRAIDRLAPIVLHEAT
jgi:hypothetical protein